MSTANHTTSPNDSLSALEQWLDGDRSDLSGEEQVLAQRLDALRHEYRGQRYLGPAPDAELAVTHRTAWWRPAAIAGMLAVALVVVLVMHPGPGPQPETVPVTQGEDWVADSAGARLRALRADLQAAVNAPAKPTGLRFAVPQRPQRVSGFASPAEIGSGQGDPQTRQTIPQQPADPIS